MSGLVSLTLISEDSDRLYSVDPTRTGPAVKLRRLRLLASRASRVGGLRALGQDRMQGQFRTSYAVWGVRTVKSSSRSGRVYARVAVPYRRLRLPCGPLHGNAALCGLPLDGSDALLVQRPIACSVGRGSERWFPTPEASTRAPAFTFHVPKPSSE